MVRFVVLAASLLLVAGASGASARDDAEVTRLKEKIELLETKLKLAEREIADLKKENADLKASDKGGDAKPGKDDGFGVGTRLTGPYAITSVVKGKRDIKSYDLVLEVTKRDGKKFTAEWTKSDGTRSWELEGTIENGAVKFEVTKDLIGQSVAVVGLHKFSGRLEKGVLKGVVTSKGDASFRGEPKLEVKKD